MNIYTATIQHHSIARARTIEAGVTLAAAKLAATREFGLEQLDYTIVIMCGDEVVADRKVRDRRWNSGYARE